MELTYEQWQKKNLRRSFGITGWILLVYYGIMNAAVVVTVVIEMIIRMMGTLASGELESMMDAAMGAAESAWGYFLAVAVGLVILLCWKKKQFWKEEIWAKGKPMTGGSFFAILCIFLSVQSVYQCLVMGLELLLNGFGLSVLEGMETLAAGSNSFSMFLYTGILGPVAEEILFRGLIQKTLDPWGKKFAIVCSAFTFGIFHGNIFQTPYAFLVGLVLGYVAAEYSIAWAMLLHMINNLVIADLLNRLTMGLPEVTAGMIITGIIWAFTIAAIVVLIVKRKQIGAYLRRERMNGLYLRCFFSSAGMIVLMVVMALSMVLTTVVMIAPI